ncbi:MULTISPECIES: ankyrin repeat domain-containing protein [Pseudoalteromonas]|uniref:ankyrin repeat domain-containing protein n=1 Tax=Pseudoalteromonas TaxID=53246 RepID=UPI000FFE7FE1|nr:MULTISPECIES: ankyrin repeat domain-containing protein [Pseudoalteromonas]NKC18274.1 ankyrin repeat domain-containing protein [Pseudoalteromonas galatheae]RXE85219.1 ankyrin repeat domain-containing protein [Pseudoalteromonas sp. A757]
MEQVLIWPAQYPMLLKGLIEQNGAYILDAIEAWPNCQQIKDEQGVTTTVLPPLFYLAWLRPLEPFEACYFQHIDDYDDKQRQYVNSVIQHIEDNETDQDELIKTLIQRLGQYSNIQVQVQDQHLSFVELLCDKQYEKTLIWLLEIGVKFSAKEIVSLWCNSSQEIHTALLTHLDTCMLDRAATAKLATDSLLDGQLTFELLCAMCDEDEVSGLLEQALLFQLTQQQVKQSAIITLVTQGAKGTARDSSGRSAIMLAVENGFVSAVETMLPHHNVNELDESGRNLMHYAAASNSAAMIEMIFEHGDDPTLADIHGDTPYRVAMKNQALTSKQTFEQHGIIELSNEAKYQKIKTVHILYAFAAILLPLQLFLFFTDEVDEKTIATLVTTAASIAIFVFARRKRSNPLYPNSSTPWSLIGVNALAWLSIGVQVLFSVLVLIAVLSLQ